VPKMSLQAPPGGCVTLQNLTSQAVTFLFLSGNIFPQLFGRGIEVKHEINTEKENKIDVIVILSFLSHCSPPPLLFTSDN
jgi:hypothetical protein